MDSVLDTVVGAVAEVDTVEIVASVAVLFIVVAALIYETPAQRPQPPAARYDEKLNLSHA